MKLVIKPKPLLVSIIYGLMAGSVAALVLWAMNKLTDIIWHHGYGDKPLFIFGTIMAGGVLIALLRHIMQGRAPDLARQIKEATDKNGPKASDIALLAAIAIISVAFGGAVGPEAGILAVVAELSVIVSLAIRASKEEQQLIGEVGVAAALGGLYASPPGGALIPSDDEQGGDTLSEDTSEKHSIDIRPLLLLAGLMGFIGFLATASWILDGDGMRVALPTFEQTSILATMLHSILPAILGGLAGLLFVIVVPILQKLFSRLGGIIPQTLVGTALFATLAAIWPIIRFSGHHELLEMSHWAIDSEPIAVLSLALLKITALSLCLSSG